MADEDEEEWRPVLGTLGYYSVSSLGRVSRNASGIGTFPGRILRPTLCDGYLIVGFGLDGYKLSRFVHQLVCEVFHGPRPDGMEVRHLDGSRDNNRAENLCWGTPSENRQDMLRHGTSTRKLTDAQAEAIRHDPRAGPKIAAEYGVSIMTVSRIKRGVAYRTRRKP